MPTLLSPAPTYRTHSLAGSLNSVTSADALPSKFAISRITSWLSCRGCPRSLTTNPKNLPILARRGLLQRPAEHPLFITLIVFAAVVFPLLCLYGLRLYARGKRAREREIFEVSLRYRMEVQRNIDQLEQEFMIPGSVAEPLPPYLPRPPAYSLELECANCSPTGCANTVSPEETKVTPPLPVLSRQRSATCFESLGTASPGPSFFIARTCTQ